MSADDIIRRIDLRRAIYKNNIDSNSSELVRSLQEIKSELKLQTDVQAVKDQETSSNGVRSPYLPDQMWHNPKIVYNSEREIEWKDVKTYEEVRGSEVFQNKKKLNII